MTIQSLLKEIARGKDGARSLNGEQAQELMAAVLDGRASVAQRAGFAIAMRVKGETAAELAGFLRAAQPHLLPLPNVSDAPCPLCPIWLPSYNGARRLPNLTPLLALLLAQQGVPVLVHGVTEDAARTTSAAVFQALGLAMTHSAADLAQAWARNEPAFMPLRSLCPPLAEFLTLRQEIGVRNSGHTVAKLLHAPDTPALRVVNHTHPEFAASLAELLQATQAHAMLMRGTEGEPVADARRTPRMDVYLHGVLDTQHSVPAQGGSLHALPGLPGLIDAASTAAYTRQVASGALPLPAPLQQQLDALIGARRALLAAIRH